jgi:hypothetical protein
MKRRYLSPFLFLVLVLLFIAGSLRFLQSAPFINRMAGVVEPYSGYRVRVQRISFDRHLRTTVEGLEVRGLRGERPFFLSCRAAEVTGHVRPFHIQVERMVLRHPRFLFQIRKEKGGPGLFEVLRGIPPVRLLVMEEGELEVKGADGARYALPGINLTVRDFSPSGGGRLEAGGTFDVSSPDARLKGSFSSSFAMARFCPEPWGQGSARVVLDGASFGAISVEKAHLASGVRLRGERVELPGLAIALGRFTAGSGQGRVEGRDIRLAADFSYDQRSSRLVMSSVKGQGAGVGSLEGQWQGTIRPFVWRGALHAQPVDLPAVFSMFRPLLADEYQSWRFKGTGMIDVTADGRTGPGGAASWKADVQVRLADGGFASGDNLKAGEGITGTIHLLLDSSEVGLTRQGFTPPSRRRRGASLGELLQELQGRQGAHPRRRDLLGRSLSVVVRGQPRLFRLRPVRILRRSLARKVAYFLAGRGRFVAAAPQPARRRVRAVAGHPGGRRRGGHGRWSVTASFAPEGWDAHGVFV